MHGTVTLGRTRTAQLATITTTAAKRCSAFDSYASLTYKQKGTWTLHGVTKTAHGTTNVSIHAVTLVLSSSPCTLTVSGTADEPTRTRRRSSPCNHARAAVTA